MLGNCTATRTTSPHAHVRTHATAQRRTRRTGSPAVPPAPPVVLSIAVAIPSIALPMCLLDGALAVPVAVRAADGTGCPAAARTPRACAALRPRRPGRAAARVVGLGELLAYARDGVVRGLAGESSRTLAHVSARCTTRIRRKH